MFPGGCFPDGRDWGRGRKANQGTASGVEASRNSRTDTVRFGTFAGVAIFWIMFNGTLLLLFFHAFPRSVTDLEDLPLLGAEVSSFIPFPLFTRIDFGYTKPNLEIFRLPYGLFSLPP